MFLWVNSKFQYFSVMTIVIFLSSSSATVTSYHQCSSEGNIIRKRCTIRCYVHKLQKCLDKWRNIVEWLKHFVRYGKSTQESSVVLILYNHRSHISLPVFNCLLSIPPHISKRTQPLDISLYGHLKLCQAYENTFNGENNAVWCCWITQQSLCTSRNCKQRRTWISNPNVLIQQDVLAATFLKIQTNPIKSKMQIF